MAKHAEIMALLSFICVFAPPTPPHSPSHFSISAVWRHFDRIAPATGKQEKQMGSELMDVDGYCFLLISIGWGAGDRESPLVGAAYRLAEEEQQGCAKGSSVQAKRVGMWPVWKVKAQPVISDTGYYRVKRSQFLYSWKRAAARSTFRLRKGTVSHPWAQTSV